MIVGPVRTDWRLVGLLWLAGLGAAAQYGKVSVVFNRLGALYPEVGALLGWAVSLVGGVGIVLGVTAGVVVARVTLRRAMIWGLWLGAAMSFVQAATPALPLFLASRVVEGLSHLAIVVAAPTLIAGISRPQDQGVTLSLWGTFFGVAFTVLVWGGLPLVDRYGVPVLFAAHGAFMAGFAVVLARVLPRETGGDVHVPKLRAILGRHAQIYSSPRIGAPAAGWLFYTFSYVSLLTLLPPYLDPGSRALVLGAMPLISIVASMTLGVWLMRRVSPVYVVQLSFLSAAVLALCLGMWQGHPALCLALAAALGLAQGAGFAAVPFLNATGADRALSNGGMAQTGNIGNTLGTPVLFFVATTMGYTSMLITLAAVLVMGFATHAGLHLLRSRRTC
ncbi:MFS transporter [Tropicimonas sp. S265A]|uniref:MFS transporter n=1 Tax=Tropicimonas sp. S265A TaxID=3415134 RepID=UPI003C7E6E0A